MKTIRIKDTYFRLEDSVAAERVKNEGARYVSKSKFDRVLKNFLKKENKGK